MPYVDLFLYDLKCIDSILHRKGVGVGNEKILKNFEFLTENKIPHIIRMPVIPEVNDSEDNFKHMTELLKNDSALICFELLPYHKTAGAKYKNVGREYTPPFNTEKYPVIHKEILENTNIRYKIL